MYACSVAMIMLRLLLFHLAFLCLCLCRHETASKVVRFLNSSVPQLYNASASTSASAYWVSQRTAIYRMFPDNDTLHFYGFSHNDVATVSFDRLAASLGRPLVLGDPIPSVNPRQGVQTRPHTCDDYDDQTSLKCRILQDDDGLVSNLQLITVSGWFYNPAVVYVPSFRKHFVINAGVGCDEITAKAFKDYHSGLKSLEVQDASKDLCRTPHVVRGEDPRVVFSDEANDTSRVILLVTNTGGAGLVKNGVVRPMLTYASINAQGLLTVINETILEPPTTEPKAKWEKNWTPFIYSHHHHNHQQRRQQTIYFVQSMFPDLVVLRQAQQSNPLQQQTEIVSKTRSELLDHWEYGSPRGGTPFKMLGRNHYLSFFHSLHNNKYCCCHPTFASYYIGAVIINSESPFKVTGISRVPLYHDGWYKGKWIDRKTSVTMKLEYVFFPMNFYYVDSKTGDIIEDLSMHSTCNRKCLERYNVTISYGQQDNCAYLANINLLSLYDTMNHRDHVSVAH